MYKLHKFRPGETIDAVIKLLGRHDFTPDEVLIMRYRFNALNGIIVPRAGWIFKIPLPHAFTDDYGNTVAVEYKIPDPIEEDPSEEPQGGSSGQ